MNNGEKASRPNMAIVTFLSRVESECYLIPELGLKLSEYSREELLKRAIVVIAREV